ncbi:MAG: HNH endonuclease signature motif containing protein [Caldilineaceae bacterium]
MSLSEELREIISKRADYRCEYCLLHQDHSVKAHHGDHIIPRKHGGTDDLDNLAWSCFLCNSAKGSEVGAYDPLTGQLVPVYNPRTDDWNEHFQLSDGKIVGLTPVGRVTEMVLLLNREDRINSRRLLMEINLYP